MGPLCGAWKTSPYDALKMRELDYLSLRSLMELQGGAGCCAHTVRIAALVFPEMDQIDFTGPFEVLSRLPDAKVDIAWKELEPVRDAFGLVLTPNTRLESEFGSLDVLIVPGGRGQVPLMGGRSSYRRYGLPCERVLLRWIGQAGSGRRPSPILSQQEDSRNDAWLSSGDSESCFWLLR